jgi:sulfopyruvate decarboxylase subunit alpha
MSLEPHWAAGVCEGLHAVGSRHVVYVPDNPLSHVLRILDREYADVRRTVATREEEAFGIAAGMYLGGARPTVMLQSSGLGNSLNALTSLLIPYKIPALVIISMRGDVGEWNDAQVPMGRALRAILDAIGLPHATAESPETTAETVRLVGQTAFGTRQPGVCLLPRRVTVPAGGATTRDRRETSVPISVGVQPHDARVRS